MIKYLLAAFCLVAIGWEAFALNQPSKAIPVEHYLVTATATIANGATVSAAIPTNGFALVGIQLPAAFTGTTVTFQGSVDGTTYQVIKSTTSGSSLSYTVAQGTYAAIDPIPFYGLKFIKLVSGSAEGGARTFSVALKGI